jgi:hypothetical protein
MDNNQDTSSRGFSRIPESIQTWFLDTCVWGEILLTNERKNAFIAFFHDNNYLAGLTTYSLFELSQAKKLLHELDDLFYEMRHNIWIAQLYDELFESELKNYPNKPVMGWMPMSMLTGEESSYEKVMTKLANNPLFVKSRSEHQKFGLTSFLSLEDFKKNFPASENSKYSTDQAHTFSFCNGIVYFLRHEPHVIKKIGPRNFLPEGLPSQYIRSLLLFYKYYIHEKSPNDSDFIDFAHVSYSPYFDVYVTERDVSNVLKHIRSTGLLLEDVEIMHVAQLINLLKSA